MIAYVFQKYPENFAFRLFIIFQEFTLEICNFLKKYPVEVHFGNSVHDSRNWGKIYDDLKTKIHILNRMQLSLRGKN